MSIVKMRFVNILGKLQNFDYVAEKYLSKINIQLENAAEELKNVNNLTSMSDQNPYVDILKRAEKNLKLGEKPFLLREMDRENAETILNSAFAEFENAQKQKEELISHKEQLLNIKTIVKPFMNLDFDIEKLLKFEFIEHRFGRIPKDFKGIEKTLTPSTENEYSEVLREILPYITNDFSPKNNRLSPEKALGILKEVLTEVNAIRQKKAAFMRQLLESETEKSIVEYLNKCSSFIENRKYIFGKIPKYILEKRDAGKNVLRYKELLRRSEGLFDSLSYSDLIKNSEITLSEAENTLSLAIDNVLELRRFIADIDNLIIDLTKAKSPPMDTGIKLSELKTKREKLLKEERDFLSYKATTLRLSIIKIKNAIKEYEEMFGTINEEFLIVDASNSDYCNIYNTEIPVFVVTETHHGLAYGILFSPPNNEVTNISGFEAISLSEKSSTSPESANERLALDIYEADLRIKAAEAELTTLISKRMRVIKPAIQKLMALKPREKDAEKPGTYYVFDNSKIQETSGEERGIEAIFIPSFMDRSHIWGIYFMPKPLKRRIDAVFAFLHFERFYIPSELTGKPSEMLVTLKNQIAETEKQILNIDKDLSDYMDKNADNIKHAYYSIKQKSLAFNIRKYAARAKGTFYVVGWMTAEDALSLQKEMEQDTRATCIVEDENAAIATTPPTKLRNSKILKPFEMYLKMYGLPAYGEMDPTAFMALSYAILFGMMFGDVGQGALLLVLGALIYKFKKIDIAGIIALSGAFSVFFGFMYGSIFGNEEILEAIWLKPTHSIMTILITTVAIGALLILTVMLFNIFISFKSGNFVKAICGSSGIAGFVFYGTIIMKVISIFLGIHTPIALFVTLIIIPLLVIFLEEPIHRWTHGYEKILPDTLGMFIMQTFFELFEVLLSYITNTVSFVRVGAFALSHSGMMLVVGILMNMAGEGSVGYYIVFALGNLLVIGLEGLIVSIQVLRLEFYEMFSRFFSGSGRPFVPYR